MHRRKFVLATTAAVSTVGIAGCAEEETPVEEDDPEDEPAETELDPEEETEQDEEPDTDEDTDPADEPETLEIVEHELVDDDFITEVEGIVENTGDEEESYVAVEVTFYDADGRRIDDSFTNTTDLGPGEEWVFSVSTTEDAEDIDDYDIEVSDSPL